MIDSIRNELVEQLRSAGTAAIQGIGSFWVRDVPSGSLEFVNPTTREVIEIAAPAVKKVYFRVAEELESWWLAGADLTNIPKVDNQFASCLTALKEDRECLLSGLCLIYDDVWRPSPYFVFEPDANPIMGTVRDGDDNVLSASRAHS